MKIYRNSTDCSDAPRWQRSQLLQSPCCSCQAKTYLFIYLREKKETEGMFLVQKLYKWSKIPTPFLYYGNFKHEIKRVADRLREEYINHFCSSSPVFFECLIPMSIQGDPLHWYFKKHRQVGWNCLQNTSCRSV